MAVNPAFVGTIKNGAVKIQTANTNLDGTGALGILYTAGASGSRIDRVKCKAMVTTTAGMLRFFLYDGAAYHLYHEEPTAAFTISGTVAADEHDIIFNLVLQTGWTLQVSTHNAESWQISTGQSGDF